MPTSSGRERLLHEAVRLFGEGGYEGTSVRQVAEAAGMSAASVIHHFGSKENLRQATDDRVLGELAEWLRTAVRQVLQGGPAERVGDLVGEPAVRAYLRRVLLVGGPAGCELMQDLVAIACLELEQAAEAGRVRPGTDLQYAAVQVVGLLVGPLVLGPLLPAFEATTSRETVAARARQDAAFLREGLLPSL